MQVGKLNFEDPPDNGYFRSDPKLIEFAEALKEHPGKWARYDQTFPAVGSSANRMRKLRSLGLETAGRRIAPGVWGIFARWPEGGAS